MPSSKLNVVGFFMPEVPANISSLLAHMKAQVNTLSDPTTPSLGNLLTQWVS